MLLKLYLVVVLNLVFCRWTFRKLRTLTARTRSARSIPCTRWRSIRKVKIALLPKESVVMIVNNLVMEVRPSPSSTRRLRQLRRLCWGFNAKAASISRNARLRGASTFRSVETRREREHLSFKLLFHLSTFFCFVWYLSCFNTVIYFESTRNGPGF